MPVLLGARRIHPRGAFTIVPEYLAVRNAFAEKPLPYEDEAYNTFVRSLVDAGAWATLDVVQIYGTHALELINWKNPGTFNPSLANAPVFERFRGITTDGVSSYIDTGFNPSTAGGNFTQNNNCFGVRTTNNVTVGNVAGWTDGTDGILVNPRSASDVVTAQANATSATTATGTFADSRVLQMVNRSSTASVQIYRDGLSITLASGGTTLSQALNNSNLFAGRVATASFRAAQVFSLYAGAMNGTRHAALAAADLALAQALGAVQ